jgi:hypothetical protein
MSTIGSPIETSLLQAAQAQQSASKAKDKQRAASESARRYQDIVDLRVAGLETADAVRRLPRNDSEQAEDEHQRRLHQPIRTPRDEPSGVDLTA